MLSSKPTIVLVHGAWHSPEHFQVLATNLNRHGYKTVSVALPSVHYALLNQTPPSGLAEDINAIRTSILSELTANPSVDVLLLTHSYSSVPGSAAIESLDKRSRLAAGYTNEITSLLVIAGLLIPNITPYVWGGSQVPPTVKLSLITSPPGNTEIEVSTPVEPPGPIELFYHDMSVEKDEYYALLLKPHVWAVHLDVVPFAGYSVVPVSYLVCEDDKALPPQFQRMMIEG